MLCLLGNAAAVAAAAAAAAMAAAAVVFVEAELKFIETLTFIVDVSCVT